MPTPKQYPLSAMYFLLVCCSVQSSLIAQEYYKKLISNRHSFEGLAEVAIDNDGSVFLFQEIYASPQTADSIVISKFSRCGNLMWSYIYPTHYNLSSNSSFTSWQRLKVDKFGRPVFIGAGYHNAKSVIVLIRFSENGSSAELAKEYSSNHFLETKNFKISKAGEYLIGTSFDHNKSGVIKLASDGSILHSAIYDTTSYGINNSFCFIDNNSAIISGTNSIIKMSPLGSVKWKKQLFSGHISALIKSDNTILVLINEISSNSTLLRLTEQGDTIGNALYMPNFRGKQLIRTEDGEIVLVGTEKSGQPGNLKFNTVIHVISDDGIIVKSIRLEQSPYIYNEPLSAQAMKGDLYLSCRMGKPSDQGFLAYQMIGKLPLNNEELFCDATAFTATHSKIKVQNTPGTPLPVQQLFLNTANIQLQSSSYNWKQDSTCTVKRTYPSLLVTENIRICRSSHLDIIDSTIHPSSVVWSTGDTSEIIRVYKEGPYWVNMTFPCDDSVYTDTVYVTFYPQADTNITVIPRSAELNEEIEFSSQGLNDSIFWQFEDGYTSGDLHFARSFEASGWKHFEVSFYTTDGCLNTISDSVLVRFQEVSVPNIFTPNGDGTNDEMHIKGEAITSFELHVFNRWGAQVIHLKNRFWNGTNENGSPSPDGVYFYIFNYITPTGEKLTEKGSVTLMRGTP